MSTGELRLYLLNKPEGFEDYPFGPRVAVMKVRSKMFATLVEDEGGVSMMDNSYALVVRGLNKTARQSLEICYGRAALYPGAET